MSDVEKCKKEGEAVFKLHHGMMSKQRAFIEKLIELKNITVLEIIDLCYSEEKKMLSNDDNESAYNLLSKVRSLVSDIRKKLEKAGINKEIISPLGPNIYNQSRVFLQVKAIIFLDEKHFESKSKVSFKPVVELEVKKIISMVTMTKFQNQKIMIQMNFLMASKVTSTLN